VRTLKAVLVLMLIPGCVPMIHSNSEEVSYEIGRRLPMACFVHRKLPLNVEQRNVPTANKYAIVSWYGRRFHGKYMSCWNKCGRKSRERFDMYNRVLAAHKTLPFGTRVRLTNPKNGRSLVVVIKDRGPYVKGRMFDVSYAAAVHLGFRRSGVAKLLYRIL
jgi:rare lipoprotein A